MLTKTKELSGVALDWAVAKAIGRNMVSMGDGEYGEWDESDPIAYDPLPKYSSDWAHIGLLIEYYAIRTTAITDATWQSESMTHSTIASATDGEHKNAYLTAACRAIVMAEIGHKVEIPDDLCGGGG